VKSKRASKTSAGFEASIERHAPLAAAAAAVASHLTALGAGWVWLDHAHIEDGLALASPSNLASLFTRGFAGTGYYRPLVSLSFSIDALLSKTPAFFHAVTLGWHAAAAAMVVVAARALGCSRRASLLAGLVFAVHPITSLVASAVAFRSEAMIAVFLLWLVVAHVRKRALLAAIALFLGALTKETGWLLGPLFVAALELGAPSRDPAAPARLAVRRRLLIAEGIAFVAATGLRLAFAPRFRAEYPSLTFDEQIGTRLAALSKSALSVLFPIDRSICDAFEVTGVASFSALLGALVLGGVVLLARRRGIAWLFALALLPSLQLVPVMRWWSPHYLYVPLAFGAMLLAKAAEPRLPRPWLVAAAIGSPLVVFSLLEGSRYQSDATLWRAEVRKEPACREGHYYLAEAARQQGDWQTAAKHYERAATPVSGYLAYVDEGSALQNLGAARFAEQRFPEARAAWQDALERSVDPKERGEIVHNLAVLALRTGDPAEAERLLSDRSLSTELGPASLLVRAQAVRALGREEEAREILRALPAAAAAARGNHGAP
jgi:tetratricopeptide (TPR) repeat protein